jgi:hypothetical protein
MDVYGIVLPTLTSLTMETQDQQWEYSKATAGR